MIIPGVQMPHCAPTSLDERVLQRMLAAESFDRRHLGAFDLRDGHEARVDRLAVEAPCTRRTRLRRSLPWCR